MYKRFLTLFLSLGVSFLQAAESSFLIVGTNAEFPPFCYIENKTIIGFDIDIAQEVAKKLNKPIYIKDMPFDALIPEICLGKVDFVAAGMSYTEERAKRVLFTKPYLSGDPFVIFSLVQKQFNLDDLKDKTVVVVEGFTADHFMSANKSIRLIRLPTQADCFIAIKSGRADAFITAKSTVDAFFEGQDPSKFHITRLEGTGETCALALPKSKAFLLLDIQKALDDLEKDGTLAKLKIKWKLQ